jgi:hypothetical protein
MRGGGGRRRRACVYESLISGGCLVVAFLTTSGCRRVCIVQRTDGAKVGSRGGWWLVSGEVATEATGSSGGTRWNTSPDRYLLTNLKASMQG